MIFKTKFESMQLFHKLHLYFTDKMLKCFGKCPNGNEGGQFHLK